MNNNTYLHKGRQWVAPLLLTIVVLFSAVYAPVFLDEWAGASLTTSAYACVGQQTGGGDC